MQSIKTAFKPSFLPYVKQVPERQYSFFDAAHWQDVQAERIRQGLDLLTMRGKPVAHSMVGRELLNLTTNEKMTVITVKKDWKQGWFLLAECMPHSGSGAHETVIENISSTHPAVIAELSAFADSYRSALTA